MARFRPVLILAAVFQVVQDVSFGGGLLGMWPYGDEFKNSTCSLFTGRARGYVAVLGLVHGDSAFFRSFCALAVGFGRSFLGIGGSACVAFYVNPFKAKGRGNDVWAKVAIFRRVYPFVGFLGPAQYVRCPSK